MRAILAAAIVLGTTSAAAAPTTDDVYKKLYPSCGACHGQGANKPLFASPPAFANLVAGNPAYVTPGKPDASPLISLLNGMGTGAFRQMPPVESFVSLAGKGQTQISLADVRAWIAALAAATPANASWQGAPSIRRLAAEQLRQSLYDQLGITDADLGSSPYAFTGSSGGQIWANLGAPNWSVGKPRSDATTPSFFQTLVPLSQSFCRIAVAKKGNTALLKYVTLVDKSAQAAAGIKKNIGYMYLRMIGDVAAPAVVDDLYQTVYLPNEATGTDTAWTAVCAALIRHPLWLVY